MNLGHWEIVNLSPALQGLVRIPRFTLCHDVTGERNVDSSHLFLQILTYLKFLLHSSCRFSSEIWSYLLSRHVILLDSAGTWAQDMESLLSSANAVEILKPKAFSS